jgi:hypothetical protein
VGVRGAHAYGEPPRARTGISRRRGSVIEPRPECGTNRRQLCEPVQPFHQRPNAQYSGRGDPGRARTFCVPIIEKG